MKKYNLFHQLDFIRDFGLSTKIRNSRKAGRTLEKIKELEIELDDCALESFGYTHSCPCCGRNLIYGGHTIDSGVITDSKKGCELETMLIRCDNCHRKSIWIFGILPGAPYYYTGSLNFSEDTVWKWSYGIDHHKDIDSKEFC